MSTPSPALQHVMDDPEFHKLSGDAQVEVLKHLQGIAEDPERGAAAATAVAPHTWRDTLKESALKGATWLPAVGGAAGGIIGGAGGSIAGGAGGAALGGVAGKAGQRLLETAVYGKEPTGQTGVQAATELGEAGGEQALAEVGGRALAKGAKLLGGPAGERVAARPLNRMLRSSQTVRYPSDVGAKSIGEIMAKEPLPTFTTVLGMKDAVRGRINFLTEKLGTDAAKLTETGRTVDLLKPVGESIEHASKVLDEFNQKQLIENLSQLEKDITTKEVSKSFMDTTAGGMEPLRVRKGLDKLTPTDAIKFRRGLDKLINTPGATPGMKSYLEHIRTRVGKSLHEQIPELAPTDEKISYLIDGEELLK